MEGYAEQVVETLTGAGYRPVRDGELLPRRPRPRARDSLGIWRGADYLGVGVGAVSTLGRTQRHNLPSLGRYVDAPRRGTTSRELEPLDGRTRAVERLMLGLRLDEPFPLDDVASVVDRDALARLAERGLVELRSGRRRGAPHPTGDSSAAA